MYSSQTELFEIELDVALKTCRKQWIEKSGKKGSGIYVLIA